MRLVLALTPSAVEFTDPRSGGPYPYLLKVSALRLSARAGTPIGIAAKENSSLQVLLDNTDKRVAGIIDRPLRVLADIYKDDGTAFFSGLVASIQYGQIITLGIEA